MTSEDVTKLEAADSAVFCPQSRSGMHPKLNRLTDNLRSAIKVQLKPEKKIRPEQAFFSQLCCVYNCNDQSGLHNYLSLHFK